MRLRCPAGAVLHRLFFRGLQMPFRQVKSSNPSIFSRTVYSHNSAVVRVDDHDVPPPQGPQATGPQSSSPSEMELDQDVATSPEYQPDIGDSDLPHRMNRTPNIDTADRAYSELLAAMMQEPLPSDTVSAPLPYVQHMHISNVFICQRQRTLVNLKVVPRPMNLIFRRKTPDQCCASFFRRCIC